MVATQDQQPRLAVQQQLLGLRFQPATTSLVQT
jgi:hypothetical protein